MTDHRVTAAIAAHMLAQDDRRALALAGWLGYQPAGLVLGIALTQHASPPSWLERAAAAWRLHTISRAHRGAERTAREIAEWRAEREVAR